MEDGDMSMVKTVFPEHKGDSCPFTEGYIYQVGAFKLSRTNWLYWGKEFGKKLIYFVCIIQKVSNIVTTRTF